eukprot:364793-Chlamydomonas_euryale.AAC.1
MDTSGAASASAADAAAAATAAAMRGSGEERFNDAYEKALLRKRLFKMRESGANWCELLVACDVLCLHAHCHGA